MRRALLLLALAACDDTPAAELALTSAVPDYAPLSGGTPSVLLGAGFLADGGASPRVLIGGREVALAHAVDDGTLAVIVPPGDAPGDVEVVVFDRSGSVTQRGILRYSAPPAVTEVSPATIVTTDPPPNVTLTGTGFVAEGAGTPTVLVDGVPIEDVTVDSDTSLSFVAPIGLPLSRARIELVNERGLTSVEGFRYVPSARPGLLLFTRFADTFATFIDPVDLSRIVIPLRGSPMCPEAIVRDESERHLVMDCQLGLGTLDVTTQTLVDVQFRGHFPYSMVMHRGVLYAIDASSLRFGTIATDSLVFTPIGDAPIPCCEYGIASDGTTIWITGFDSGLRAIRTIDPETGIFGPSVPLVPGTMRIEDLRWYAGTLFATTSAGLLVTIDPASGAITTRLGGLPRSHAIEIFD